MNPSIITCPVKVPVIVEFCPEASNATANNVERIPYFATVIKIQLLYVSEFDKASYNPKNDGSFTAPVLKTATPIMSNKELTKKARVN